jgi:hypothetical protein
MSFISEIACLPVPALHQKPKAKPKARLRSSRRDETAGASRFRGRCRESKRIRQRRCGTSAVTIRLTSRICGFVSHAPRCSGLRRTAPIRHERAPHHAADACVAITCSPAFKWRRCRRHRQYPPWSLASIGITAIGAIRTSSRVVRLYV